MNRILPEDMHLCQHMILNSESSRECMFFNEILKKETSEISLSGDLLMSELDNNLGIYILREIYDEYRVGLAIKGDEFPELHIDGIAALISTPLKEIGLSESGTIGEWLRGIEYEGINYKANTDIY